MTVLRESLPLHDFARLLGISHNQVRGVQSRLTALQTRGLFDEQIVPPASERFHSSFIEFTMNREAETSNSSIPYQIDPQMAHQSMAEGCLSFLHNFFSSFRGRECRHSDLRAVELYTVKFWPLHMVNSNDRLTPLPSKLNNLLWNYRKTIYDNGVPGFLPSVFRPHLRIGTRFFALSIRMVFTARWRVSSKTT